MSKETEQEVAEVGVRLLDDAYMAWFIAESESEQALRAWFKAAPAQRAESYLVYLAALDREEAAAHDLERLSHLTEPCQSLLAGWEQAGLQ
jgi:hypothetical protein